MSIDHGTFLVVMKIKSLILFSTVEYQLLTYLAILRKLRIDARKINVVTQDFYTDDFRYCFMTINLEGEIEASKCYDVGILEDGKFVFNFIVTMLKTAMRSSSTVTPTKGVERQEMEVNNFTEEVWDMPDIVEDDEDDDYVSLPSI